MLIFTSIASSYAVAHAEHDKARFVAADGQDKGRCDTPIRPCKSIAYAVLHAKKGDKVLVAGGDYTIKDADELLALTSDMVPVLGGYNRFDHFLNQAPTLHTTTLYGVPKELKSRLYNQGFHVIQDGLSRYHAEFQARQVMDSALQQAHSTTSCVNGKAGNFSCKNIDLVSHVPLNGFSKKPTAGNDIWGHVDLNDNTEYAIMGFNTGVAVVSLKDPTNPTEIGFITGQRTTWRDIKVYQYYSEAQKRWLAYAYVTSESGSDGVMIVDLSQLPNRISLVGNDLASARAHNVYISNVDYSLNIGLNQNTPTLHLVGENVSGGAYRNFKLDNPRELSAASPTRATTRADYTHDAVSFWVTDNRAARDCANASQAGCEVFVDFNEEEVRLWDITDKAKHNELGNVTYSNAEYIHSGWWSEDGQYLFVHDELDEQTHSLNTTVRVFDVSQLTAPLLVSEWQGPTKAIDHNGFVKGNRYYMSNYQRGLTVLDISDPKNPTEVGFFDTFPNSDGAQFNGAWGTYPYLPSGLVLVSDINSGLYILKDNTKTSTAGQISLPSQPISVENDAVKASVNVVRAAGSNGTVSVKYDLLAGNTSPTEVPFQSGTLTWSANEVASKTIEIPLANTDTAINKSLFVRLHSVTGGATLGQSLVRVNFGQTPVKIGYADLANSSLRVVENSGEFNISLLRVNGSEQTLTVNYAFDSDASNDISGELNGSVTWQAGESTAKVLTFSVIDDELNESDESFNFTISGDAVGTNQVMTVRVLDDESNVAPVIYLSESFEANTRQTMQVTANVADANNDAISLLWQQTAGTSVELSGSTTRTITFQTPDSAGELTFKLIATDERGKATEQSVVVKVLDPSTTTPTPVPPPTPPTESQKSSGGGGWLFLIPLFVWLRRK
ncbi:FIG01065953: hypothetical protein [Pseudoalteromonas luteoviolacea B = ATCC 29581]|nr:FIG01065953: hypothetical protein [Pseudoalteromonas luteoviolacea B = ATCC 29581]